MILTYEGHSFFTLALESGPVIAFDPYGDFYAYPKRAVRADVCLISHHHHDHDGVASLLPGAQFIDRPGRYRPLEGVTVLGVPVWHDEKQGALRGPNTFFVVEAEGMRMGHAGDLGHLLERETLRKIGPLDVVMMPVGGYYTIDAETAAENVRRLGAAVAIPMHYRTVYDPEMPIAELEAYLRLTDAENQQMPLLRLTKGDMDQRPSVITMQIAKG